eukprot:213580-Lingulodinium_polyedra.AAC.1
MGAGDPHEWHGRGCAPCASRGGAPGPVARRRSSLGASAPRRARGGRHRRLDGCQVHRLP